MSKVQESLAFPVFCRYSSWFSSLLLDAVGNFFEHSRSIIKIESEPASYPKDEGVVIVTGALGGIGRSLARQISQYSKFVILSCRSSRQTELENVANEITRNQQHKTICTSYIDMASFDEKFLKSVRNMKDFISKSNERLHCIVHNAGVMSHSSPREIHTVNTLMPLALSLLLLPQLLISNSYYSTCSKIVQISSSSHLTAPIYHSGDLQLSLADYLPADPKVSIKAYGLSKQRLMLCGAALRNRLSFFENKKLLEVVDVHPGLVNTGMVQKFLNLKSLSWFPFYRTPEQGAAAVLPAIYSTESYSDLSDPRFKRPYYVNGKIFPERASQIAYCPVAAELCFKDALRSLPAAVRKEIVDGLCAARKVSPALTRLAEEIAGISP